LPRFLSIFANPIFSTFFELLVSGLSGVANLILIQASLTGQPLAEAVQLSGRLNKVELKAGLRIPIQSGRWIRIRIQEGKNYAQK
jgi:hypothetical protein